MAEEQLLESREIDSIISDVAGRIISDTGAMEHFAVVGIQGGGVELASRLRSVIEERTGEILRHGTIDISFYRDDLATRGMLPALKETRIDFDITNMSILLVDDVIFTGRSVKAALEALMSFGRPLNIKLFCMVDRSGRELPVQPDYFGIKVNSAGVADNIKVRLYPDDASKDVVVLEKN
ncbi:MAG: bifunctional pyr operon transcriptional regulator/uracil phosphoribosyltransferase PyrR [Leptospirales bacterium]|nr:bifunctional pyr operon transcriptional regulator/uracil phosphoribosyltransferase PyrR [Leptospirales bacterium]